MTITAKKVFISCLLLLVAPSFQKKYSIVVDELFLHSSDSFDEAFGDDTVVKNYCGGSIEIANYNSQNLYISVSGKNIDHKKAIV